MYDTEVQSNFEQPGGTPSRLDLVLLNRSARLALEKVYIANDIEFPRHKQVYVTFNWTAVTQVEPRWIAPQKIPALTRPWTKQQASDAIKYT